MKSTHVLLACMPTYIPACLPVCDMFIYTYVRPISGGRIEAVFSRNAGYHHATTDLLIQWRFIHCAIVSPFILHCFSSSLTGELKNCQWIVMAYIYTCYVMLMAKMYMYMIAWSIKIINKHNVFAMCRFKSAWMVSCCSLYSMYLLEMWFPSTAAAKIVTYTICIRR